jgi:CubicO group peptidase (beta-lactamase class C family)
MTTDHPLTDRVDGALRPHVAADEVLGLTWLVAVGDDVHAGALGHLDQERSRPATVDSIYRISSMTKPITAAAALTLVDDGTLALDNPVDRWLPELAERPVVARSSGPLDVTVAAHRPITVDDVLSFRLGWGMDFTDAGPQPVLEAMAALDLGAGAPAPALPPPPDEWIRRLGTLPLQYQPGERWLYHAGADVLGVLVARAAGAPFPDVLRERIFGPLGMVDTGFSVPDGSRDRFGPVFGGTAADGRRDVYDPVDGQWSAEPAFPGGGAGLVSTVGDFARFASMLLRHGDSPGARILSAEAVGAMTTNHLTADQLRRGGPDPDGATGFGYGVGVQLRPGPGAGVGAYGWDGGLGSRWFNDPGREVVAVLLTNQMWTSPAPPSVCEAFAEVVGTVAG